jgi:plastocyanin
MIGKIAGRAAAFAAGVVLLLCAGPGVAQQGVAQQVAAVSANEVVIDNFAFGPASLTVAPGTRVVWINRDEEPHTVMSANQPALFKSGALDTGDKFEFVFDKPGTYRYFCSIHSHMVGTIVVK